MTIFCHHETQHLSELSRERLYVTFYSYQEEENYILSPTVITRERQSLDCGDPELLSHLHLLKYIWIATDAIASSQ